MTNVTCAELWDVYMSARQDSVWSRHSPPHLKSSHVLYPTRPQHMMIHGLGLNARTSTGKLAGCPLTSLALIRNTISGNNLSLVSFSSFSIFSYSIFFNLFFFLFISLFLFTYFLFSLHLSVFSLSLSFCLFFFLYSLF